MSGGLVAIDSGETLTLDSDTLSGLTLSGGTIVDASTVTVSGATTIEDAIGQRRPGGDRQRG